MKFDEIYKPPFHEVFNPWVSNEKGVHCFNFIAPMHDETRKRILDILNGESKQAVKCEVEYHGDGKVSMKGIVIMRIRGWGHLTGCSALNLPPEEAAKIQDDFGEWIVKKLKQEI